MRSKSKLPKEILEGTTHAVEFQVTAPMVEKFIELTGDRSSLHTDRAFARKSMYRENVVHGMLPVTFVSALMPCYAGDHICSFYKISAKFVRPVFSNSRLMISSKALELDDKQNQVEFEYEIRSVERDSIVATGYFTLRYGEPVARKARGKRSAASPSHSPLILDPLAEQDLQFEQISKGDEKSFQFLISEGHVNDFYEILAEGLFSDYRFDFSNWVAHCNPANLLATCLSSTFVGMCIPGKYATFMDLQMTFERPIQWLREYIFKGKVGFKSRSTFTLVEDISICDSKDGKEDYATGKIQAKVNEPPIKMPSIEYLRDKESDLQLRDKVVLITGASRGIGETTAKLFSLYGVKVVVNYFRGKEDANRIVDEILSSGGDALAVQADVSDRRQVKQMVSTICEKYRTIHILVNNAIRDTYPFPFMELTWDDFQKDIDVTLKGAFNCCQEVLPIMLRNKEGKIINISTLFADYPPPDQAKYVVSKSALVGLTRSLAVEFAHHNIQVNMVVPSIIETDLTKHVPKMFLERMKNDTPMRRNATSIDVAKAVICLASSLTSFTTGQKIMVTGGNPPFL